ncbi:MAG: GAF domain-containing protein [Pseudomonadota bacterium]
MQIALSDIAPCFEGVIPAVIATCSADGMPNITYLSHVHRMDEGHVALSAQFFNKTRSNLQQVDRAAVLVVHPDDGSQYQLDVQFLRTETEGPLFERMKARLEVIASMSGMTGRFKLIGADVFRVRECRRAMGMGMGTRAVSTAAKPRSLDALARLSSQMAACEELAALLAVTLQGLEQHLQHAHSMVLLADESGRRLYTIASHGYEKSGAGSEVRMGEGPIGIAAQRGITIRSTHLERDFLYGRAVKQRLVEEGEIDAIEQEIELPGLPETRSQMVIPIRIRDRSYGVLCLQSASLNAYSEQDEVMLRVIADHLATAALLSNQLAELQPQREAIAAKSAPVAGAPVLMRHYVHDHSIFIGGEYLIKGVAGAILWKLAGAWVGEGRDTFTNRELRLDRTLKLPELSDNLEARLVLLKQRLEDRGAPLRIEKEGRGRFRLVVSRALELQEAT